MIRRCHATYGKVVAVVRRHGDDGDAHADACRVRDGGAEEHQQCHDMAHAHQPLCNEKVQYELVETVRWEYESARYTQCDEIINSV